MALFCYQARKFLGALVAVLDGLDALVFTAVIGERAAAIRRRICDGLTYLGLELDEMQSRRRSSPRLRALWWSRVIPTNISSSLDRHFD